MTVSIIIVNYNTKELILKCLHSVYEKTSGIKYEIIVVDNASTDDSVIRIKKEFPQVILIESKENLGFGRANNLGMESAKGNYYFLLNPDTILINNAIYILASFLESHSKVAACGGQLYDLGMNKVHSYSLLFPSISWEFNLLSNGLISFIKNRNIQKMISKHGFGDVAYITGADLMIRKEIIDLCGNFDSDFFMYFEETELSYRIKKTGNSIVFVPKAKIHHLEGKSIEFMEKREQLFFKGRKTFYSKIYSSKYSLLSNLFYKLSCISRILVCFILCKFTKVNEWKMRLQVFNATVNS